MFIYDKDKNVSIFSRGKNGTTNFHNHYWMQKDDQSVGSYTDFDESKWQFATPLPAIEDMTRGCVKIDQNNHIPDHDGIFKNGNRRLGMHVFEYITFLKTCKLLDLNTRHFIIIRDPLERLASGLSTSLHNTPDDVAKQSCGYSFNEVVNGCKEHPTQYDDDHWNGLCANILKLQSSQYHAQGWLSHLDKHINFDDYKLFSVDINDLIPFAKEVVGLDVAETDADLPDNDWHGRHTGTRPPESRHFHYFIKEWIEESYANKTLHKQLTDLLDAEYKIVDKLKQINYDINN